MDALENDDPAASLRGRVRAALDWLQRGITLGVLLYGFQGRVPAGHLVLIFLTLPVLRFWLDRTFRRRLLQRRDALWISLRAYPAGARQIPWRAVFFLVVLPSALLYLSPNRCAYDADWWPVMLSASSLSKHATWELSRENHLACPDGGLPYYLTRTPSGIYPAYPSGMVAFAMPVACAARLLGSDPSDYFRHLRLDRWTSAWLSAACLGLFFLIALHLAPPGPAWMTTALLAGGSAMCSTVSQSLWQHGGVIFWYLTVLLLEFQQAQAASRRTTWAQGLALAMMLACRLSSALFIALFGLWVLLRSPRRIPALAMGAALGYLPWAVFYFSIYGNVFGPSTVQLAASSWDVGDFSSWAGVLASPARGLFVYQPWLLLLILVPFCRTERQLPLRGLRLFSLSYFAAHLALISSWGDWWGGTCWGSRLASEMVPIGGLLCLGPIAALWSQAGGRFLLAAVLLMSWSLHLPYVYKPADLAVQTSFARPQRLWSWSRAPFLYWLHDSWLRDGERKGRDRLAAAAAHSPRGGDRSISSAGGTLSLLRITGRTRSAAPGSFDLRAAYKACVSGCSSTSYLPGLRSGASSISTS